MKGRGEKTGEKKYATRKKQDQQEPPATRGGSFECRHLAARADHTRRRVALNSRIPGPASGPNGFEPPRPHPQITNDQCHLSLGNSSLPDHAITFFSPNGAPSGLDPLTGK